MEEVYSQEERDMMFLRLFGTWENPALHLNPSDMDLAKKSQDAFGVLIRIRKDTVKSGYKVMDEFVALDVNGYCVGLSLNRDHVVQYLHHMTTGVVDRDVKTGTPFLQVMDLKTRKAFWLNMKQFTGFVGRVHYKLGKLTLLLKHEYGKEV